MDAKVEVGVLSASCTLVESKTIVEILSGVNSPVVSNLSFAPSIISIGGHSISTINPESFRIGVRAAA
jgi:hypothetical protein